VGSPEGFHFPILPFTELTRRLKEVSEESRYIRTRLPPEHRFNAILRPTDIAAYIAVKDRHLRTKFMPGARFTEQEQRDLSRFFHFWDTGRVVKARFGDKWRLTHRSAHDAALAKMAPPEGVQAAPRPAIEMRIDPATLGLTVKGR